MAYVDSEVGTDNSACTVAMPCTKVASALATGRKYVKLHGTIDEAVVVDGGRRVAFFADPQTTLARSTDGTVLNVKGDRTSVEVYDLAIKRKSSSVGAGVILESGMPSISLVGVEVSNHTGLGILAKSGALTIARSTIRMNGGGGISVTNLMSAKIVSNVIYRNGVDGSAVGALSIEAPAGSEIQLDFNTIVANNSAADRAAVRCGASGMISRNNIFSENGVNQVDDGCMHQFSIFYPGDAHPGTGNKIADPMFKDAANGDFHILPVSPAVSSADPSVQLGSLTSRDRDNVPRSKPADIGAYQAQGVERR